jgi:hypothetical protein
VTARRALVLAVVLLGLASGACDRSPGAHEDPDEGDVPTCEPGFATPDGFTRTETFEDPYADHVGIRLGFSSDDGRELHAFVGVPGEFGEGLPLVDSIEAAGGIEGSLQGSGTTWVLSWRAPGPCGVRAVLGSGFTREGFVDTLERAGIVPAQ